MTSSPSAARRAARFASDRLDDLYWGARRGLRATRRFFFPVMRRDLGGVSIALRVSSAQEHFRADTYATKEPETLRWLRERLQEADVLFDVGANVGLYSLFAAKLRPSCRVVAFEPETSNFSSLCRNVLLNRLDNVVPCSFPITDREGFELFHVYDLEPGAALHSLGKPSAFRDGPATILQGTLATTLDAAVLRHGLPAPTLLKVDVDGIEERILDGAATILGSGRLRSILVEVSHARDEESSWAERKLAPLGFRRTESSAWSTEISGWISRNLIFDR